jgi:hypothetical protein
MATITKHANHLNWEVLETPTHFEGRRLGKRGFKLHAQSHEDLIAMIEDIDGDDGDAVGAMMGRNI